MVLSPCLDPALQTSIMKCSVISVLICVYRSNLKSCLLWTTLEQLVVNTFMYEIQAILASFDRSVNLCSRYFGRCSFWNRCVEGDDWFSIFIQYLVFILNTPAVTLQIATRQNLVRFRKYTAPWGWSSSGTGGQGGCGISVFGDFTLNYTRRWATWSKLVLLWVGFGWSPEVPCNLFYGSVFLFFFFFPKPHLLKHSQNIN